MKKTSGKFIIFITGPMVKYRLEIMLDACPNAKDYIIFLTNKESYELYKDFHDIFHFVFLDDYTKDFPISQQYEIFPNYKTIDEFVKNIPKFYSSEAGHYFPYDAHRFILLYLLENDILNFAIIDSDFILSNDVDRLEQYFQRIPPGFCYLPWGSIESDDPRSGIEIKRQMWSDIQPYFPNINFNVPILRSADGYMRGFHCRNKQELQLLFEIWNTAIETLFVNKHYYYNIVGNSGFLYHFEWLIAHIASIFDDQLGYTFTNCHEVMTMPNGKQVGIHVGRPEDVFYRERVRGDGWVDIGFDYSDISTISGFIKNNKPKLYKYYSERHPRFEITDTHVYTRVP